jgi:translation initiation factor 1
MVDICPRCGLPKVLCTCQVLTKEKEKVKIYSEQKRYGKSITIVTGFSQDIDVRAILKKLKVKLACGGTIKDNKIELQGNHKDKVKAILIKLGFSPEQIEMI